VLVEDGQNSSDQRVDLLFGQVGLFDVAELRRDLPEQEFEYVLEQVRARRSC
jgi:hypothetical protein